MPVPDADQPSAKSILVVEDDADCRLVLCDLLEASSYQVQSCAGAEAAVGLAVSMRPALVIADFNLLGHDGAWLVSQLRGAGGALAQVPIILTSGDIEARSIARRLDVSSLEKPYDAGRLLELVRSLTQASPPRSLPA